MADRSRKCHAVRGRNLHTANGSKGFSRERPVIETDPNLVENIHYTYTRLKDRLERERKISRGAPRTYYVVLSGTYPPFDVNLIYNGEAKICCKIDKPKEIAMGRVDAACRGITSKLIKDKIEFFP